MGVLLRRRDCYYTVNGEVCDGSTWYDWGRWIAFAVIVAVALIIFFLFAYAPHLPGPGFCRFDWRLTSTVDATTPAVGADKGSDLTPAPHGLPALLRPSNSLSNKHSNKVNDRITPTLTTNNRRRLNTPLIRKLMDILEASRRESSSNNRRLHTTVANGCTSHHRVLLPRRLPRCNAPTSIP
ncbi:hypothetical protein ASPNIDRAFT_38819 [Aspergillus niger ATCC 1015]|uniref:Uncharacterized protein n=1 Tax=Aspergillus niger (strain ATCC 1015 / CBS 113.46 / FGSC A1144 / LSHB Ac4 / NCTC 3858a / NRRL 328 / USDA 3528.7) TaxID=380704 RepID=G3YC54_ASPNA|nr:hypothetical protein ASPNIDRAFT_38819 [Aspergillus niger ATCC 1015]